MTVEDVRERHRQGERLKYVFFWGHTPRASRIDKSCLSQWFPSPFEVDGDIYPTAEHWMMAGKARLFGDDEMLDRILDAGSPGAAKKLGRRVRGFDPGTWKRHRSEIVTAGSVHKFEQTAGLGDFLLRTGDRILVEASPRDRIWGIGMAASDDDIEDPHSWRGLNLLGFCLMAARETLSRSRSSD